MSIDTASFYLTRIVREAFFFVNGDVVSDKRPNIGGLFGVFFNFLTFPLDHRATDGAFHLIKRKVDIGHRLLDAAVTIKSAISFGCLRCIATGVRRYGEGF
jgi:hypothetical protein